MKKMLKVTGFALVLLMGVSTTLNSQFGNRWYSAGDYMYQNLPDLTDKQRDQIRNLTQKHWEQMDTITKELWAANDWNKRNSATLRLQSNRIRHWDELMKILTDEQKNALMLNNNYSGFYRGRGMGPCRAGLGPGMGRAQGWRPGMGYGYGAGGGRGMGYGTGRGRGMGYGYRSLW